MSVWKGERQGVIYRENCIQKTDNSGKKMTQGDEESESNTHKGSTTYILIGKILGKY